MKKDNLSADQQAPKKSGWKNTVGEALEKVGHKISEAGMPKVGQKIHDMGDDLEENHANPQHPHKV